MGGLNMLRHSNARFEIFINTHINRGNENKNENTLLQCSQYIVLRSIIFVLTPVCIPTRNMLPKKL